jgi:hypothetical protein
MDIAIISLFALSVFPSSSLAMLFNSICKASIGFATELNYTFSPQFPQNFVSAVNLALHFLHVLSGMMAAPHSEQNFIFWARGALHAGQLALTPSRQDFSCNISLSSSATFECAQISSTVLLAWAALISTPRSGAQFLHKPLPLFQHLLLHTQELHLGHWVKSGRNSCMASEKASSCAVSQVAERAFSPRLAAWPKIPPKIPPTASSAPVTIPILDGLNLVR